MDTAQRNLAFQVQFWGLIGPLIALITMLVIFIKSPTHAIYLSIATILGLVISWKWKIQGFAISLGFITLAYLYQFSEISPDEHLWYIGMNFSIALGFVITALSFKEVEQILHPLDDPVKPFTLNTSALIEEINLAKQAVQDKSIDVQILSKEIAAKNSQIKSYESLVETVKGEILKTNESHEKLLENFFEKQQQLSLAVEKLHIAEDNIKILSEKSYFAAKLENDINQKNEEIAALKERLNQMVDSPLPDMEVLQELKSTNELLSRERGRLETLLFRTQIELHQKTQDLNNLQNLESECEIIRSEKIKLLKELQEALVARDELENKLSNSLSSDVQINELQQDLNTLTQQLAEKEAINKYVSDEKDELILALDLSEKVSTTLQQQLDEKEAHYDLALQEKDELRVSLTTAENTLVTLQKQLDEKEAHYNTVLQEKDELRVSLTTAENTLVGLQQQLNEKEACYTTALEEKDELRVSFITAENTLMTLQQQLDEKEAHYKAVLQEKDELSTSLADAESKLEKAILQKQAVEETYVNLQKEFNDIKLQPVLSTTDECTKDLIFNFKKMEGKYNQLRDQFEEKSEVLNATRRELFKAEERFMQLKLELDEKEIYDLNETAQVIQDHALKAIKFAGEEIQSLEAEINALQCLVTALIQNKS